MALMTNMQIMELSKSITSKESAEEILTNFKPIVHGATFNIETFQSIRQDKLSKALIPAGFEEMEPLSATGDGNCLFNSASIWLTGNESIAPTLRMLTAAELFAHSDFYSNHPQLPRCAQEADFSAGTLVAIFLSNKKAEEVFNGDKKKIKSAIEMLALETAKPYEYASPFVILALASVLGRPIFSVYPDIPSTVSIKRAIHGIFYPRQPLTSADLYDNAGKNNVCYIMWTRASWAPLANWKPNHFVPLVSQINNPCNSSATSCARPVKSNVSPRKNRKRVQPSSVIHIDDETTIHKVPKKDPKYHSFSFSEYHLPKTSSEHQMTRHSTNTSPKACSTLSKDLPRKPLTNHPFLTSSQTPSVNILDGQCVTSSKFQYGKNPKENSSKLAKCLSNKPLTEKPTPLSTPTRSVNTLDGQCVTPFKFQYGKSPNENPSKLSKDLSNKHATDQPTPLSTPTRSVNTSDGQSVTPFKFQYNKSPNENPSKLSKNLSNKPSTDQPTPLSTPTRSVNTLDGQCSTPSSFQYGKSPNENSSKLSKDLSNKHATDQPTPLSTPTRSVNTLDGQSVTPFKFQYGKSPNENPSKLSKDLSNKHATDQPTPLSTPTRSVNTLDGQSVTPFKFQYGKSPNENSSKLSKDLSNKHATDQPTPLSTPTESVNTSNGQRIIPLDLQSAKTSKEKSFKPLLPTSQECSMSKSSSTPSQQNECNTKLHGTQLHRPQFKRVRRHRAHETEDKTTAIKSNTGAFSSPTVKIKSFFTPIKRNAGTAVTPTPDTPVELKTNASRVNVENIFPESEGKSVLPLKGMGFQWYTKRGLNFNANAARTEERTRNTVIRDHHEMIGLVRGNIKGSLTQNVYNLVERLSTGGSPKQQEHLNVMLSLASHIINNGLIVATQDLARKYKELKNLKESAHIESSRLLEIMSKHLNLAQIYIGGKGYIIENHGRDVVKVVESLNQFSKSEQQIVNQRVEEAVGSTYDTILQYLDTKRDRDTVLAILTKITSATFLGKLAGVKDKRSFQHSKGLVFHNLRLFEEMRHKIEVTDPTLSEEGRRKKRNRLLQKMKLEKLRHVFKGRGRSLKCEEFPDLAGILEFAFGEGDRVDRASGGLKSHPRLTDTVLYRAADSNTIMKHARETILALAPEGFKISLSTCFNYTQNYREGTYQARRHHSGRGVNACLSLHKPPRIGVEQFVINLHWSTQNVNLTLDMAHSMSNNFLVDSKDAKAKINADVSPVQKPGKSWRKIILPDHDWNRLAHNAITPMSHLFLETDLTLEDQREQNLVYSVRRTGTAATLLNISYFEPETVHRVFNELFLLLRQPTLDHLFRNPDTGKLKEHFAFIVDNGPSEAPSSPLVRMWLVRLARVLKLKTLTQKSFAEYHSKRNPVERVHAVQNHALSNEQFSSTAIYPEYTKGDEKHKANMEHMAEEVRRCIANTQFGGKPCTVVRGIGPRENFVFSDEENLVAFLGKNDDTLQYKPVRSDLWKELCIVWDLDENYTGCDREDYEIMQNTFHEEGQRTCWVDKYSTFILNPDVEHDSGFDDFTIQPLPDYVRWIETGSELHYLPLEKIHRLDAQIIADTPAAFLPSKMLEMIYKVFSHGTDNILQSVSFLTWCTEKDVERFLGSYREKLDRSFANDKEREYWSQHDLYKNNNKEHLVELCRKEKLSTEGKKHDFVKRLVNKRDTTKPPPLQVYNGILLNIPDSLTDIAKLSIYRLREILRYHNVLDCGTKDELVVRVGMVKGRRKYLAFHRESEAIRNIITATRNIIIAQKRLYLEDPTVIHKRRKFASKCGPSIQKERPRDSASIPHQNQKTHLLVPQGLSFDNIEDALIPLSDELALYQKSRHEDVKSIGNGPLQNLQDAMRSVGARVKILWEKDEVQTSGWRVGMFDIFYVTPYAC